jgi:hypothetical protein
MLMNYAEAFTIISADIEKARCQLLVEAYQNAQTTLTPDHPRILTLKEVIVRLLGTCNQVPDLDRMQGPIGRLLYTLDSGTDPAAVHHQLDHLQLQLFDELGRLKLYLVPAHMVEFYEEEMPFGETVFDRFPSAVPDTRNAGRCLALGQPTACMFHLMRVMERGLAAYAAKLGIPYAPSWESYIRQLDKQFSVEWNTKTKSWKAIEPFHKEILGDLIAVKTAWRNPTVHIVNDYDAEEGERAYHAVRGFMQKLAKRVGEAGRVRKRAISAQKAIA